MRWRATTAFLLGACIVLACVVVVQYRQLHPPSPVTKIVTVVTTNQPVIQRPPHRVLPASATQPRVIRADGITSSDASMPATTRMTKGTAPDSPTETQQLTGTRRQIADGRATASESQPIAVAVVAAKSATIRGKVLLKGRPPQEKPIDMSADAGCAALHSVPVTTRQYVVGTNGGLANVFVYLRDGLGDVEFPMPRNPVVLDQIGCLYQPYVFGIQVGQDLEIRNSDPTLHNPHVQSTVNFEPGKGMPVQGMKFRTRFTKPEIMVKIKCDVHPWMFAYCGVVPHPFFETTREDGTFTLSGLPAGKYVIEAWHNKAGKRHQSVTVARSETREILFEF